MILNKLQRAIVLLDAAEDALRGFDRLLLPNAPKSVAIHDVLLDLGNIVIKLETIEKED